MEIDNSTYIWKQLKIQGMPRIYTDTPFERLWVGFLITMAVVILCFYWFYKPAFYPPSVPPKSDTIRHGIRIIDGGTVEAFADTVHYRTIIPDFPYNPEFNKYIHDSNVWIYDGIRIRRSDSLWQELHGNK